MCVIVVCRKAIPTKENLKEMFFTNYNGVGYAFRKGNFIVVRKGLMSFEEFIDAIKEDKLKEKLPAVIHFRLATTGGISPFLTHPFEVVWKQREKLTFETKNGVVFSNGTIPDWKNTLLKVSINFKSKLPEVELSDARAAAMIASKVGRQAFKLLSGKFVYFSSNRLITYGNFENQNGYLVSNLYWKNPYRNGLLFQNYKKVVNMKKKK